VESGAFFPCSLYNGWVAAKRSKLAKLRKIRLFSELSDYDLHQIDEITAERSYDKGEHIIEENAEAQRFFIIYRGKIEISKRFEDGENFVLGVHSDGEFFGEMAILDEGPRSATARALEPTTVMEVSRKDFETLLYKSPALGFTIMKELSSRLRDTGALLVAHLQSKNRQLSRAYLATVRAVVQAIEERDSFSKGHTQRVTAIAKLIGARMGLSEEQLGSLEIGALLHDVGKISVPEAILAKRGTLGPSEMAQVRRHPEAGKKMIQDVSFLSSAIPHVLYHHERFDGSGYPESLAGVDIPLPGRIVAVADVFDALTRDRPQRKRLSLEEAVEHIRTNAGKGFDPKVVEAFLAALEAGDLKELAE
jgi:HD-GYP domain-containing protein (c-di-GMP phosphodiesterase class II)